MKLNLRLPNKKGSVFEILNLLIIFVVMTFIILAFTVMWYETSNALSDAVTDLDDDNVVLAYNNTFLGPATAYAPIADWGMMFLLFGVMISVIIVSFLMQNNAIFSWIYVIVAAIMVFVSVFIANGAYAALTDPAMLLYSDQIPKTVWVIGHLLEITIVWAILNGIALFTRPPNQDSATESIGL